MNQSDRMKIEAQLKPGIYDQKQASNKRWKKKTMLTENFTSIRNYL